MNQVTRADVYAALMEKCGFEVVQEKETAVQLRIIGRSGADRWNFFLPVIHTLLTASDKPEGHWTCDISKQMILAHGRVRYGWRMIFQAASRNGIDNLQSCYEDIVRVIRSSPRPARVEVDRVLLPGYKAGDVRGGVNAKGKGAAPAGSLPLAVTRRQ
jgi:hypothetical protein